MGKEKKGTRMPSAFGILFMIIAILAVVTHFIPSVKGASLAQFVMAAPKGFVDAIDVCVFVLCIGGFLGVVNKSGALDAGIAFIVGKMGGNELWLVPILMLVFSLGGTTYGMCEETMAFYALIVGTMMAAGFDAMVGAAIILFGAGAGCLGSTVNPFAVGAAVDALKSVNVTVNQSIVIGLGAVLWLVSLLVSMIFVYRYAKAVKSRGRSVLSPAERTASEEEYLSGIKQEERKITGAHATTLVIFIFTFTIMIISLIPWESFGINVPAWTGILVGVPFGDWYFQELQAWFLIMAIVIGLVNRFSEREIVKEFINGASDMMSVVLVIAVSRGISILMKETGLDLYVLDHASKALAGVNTTVFTAGTFFVYMGLTFLIPSTSGLAAASMPTFGALAQSLGLSPEVMIMIYCASCGVVNLVTPTSAVVMGGTSIARIEYPTWVKFALPLCGILIVLNLIILSVAMMIL
ncbi:MAG: YfcC family protein [Lachnospiraceae bacterium]